jgi:hypothetical protein
MSLDINLTNVQSKPIVVSANQTAENDRVYHVVANATFTDPTPAEGKGFIVFVRNGTATIGGINYSVTMSVIVRIFHSGSWTNYRYYTYDVSANIFQFLGNISTNVNTDQASDTKYPSAKAVFDWATNLLSNKVDKVTGKELSANDFTNTLKTKLDGIQDGAEVNVNADWNATSGDAQILNKPTIPDTSDFVAKSDFTSHSILAKQSGASDPVAVSIGNNEILGRKSGGGSNIEGLSVSEVKSLLNYTASDVGAVATNSAITGATKTKITYDAKGLVTSGADATTADIADSSNKRYVTDANLTVIGNTSGTNTGDNFILSGIPFNANSSTGGSPRYYGFSDNANSSNELTRRFAIPKSCTLSNFYIRTSGTQPVSGSHVFSILKNGVATAITITVPAGSSAGLFNDTTHQVSFTGGDEISIEAVNNASATSSVVVSFSIGVL